MYTGSARTCMIQGLKCNTVYNYRIRSENTSGVSNWVNILNRTTQACAIQTPTNLTADSTITNQITLNWSDNANNENGYRIFENWIMTLIMKYWKVLSVQILKCIQITVFNATKNIITMLKPSIILLRPVAQILYV